jgi:hypothetical protein
MVAEYEEKIMLMEKVPRSVLACLQLINLQLKNTSILAYEDINELVIMKIESFV